MSTPTSNWPKGTAELLLRIRHTATGQSAVDWAVNALVAGYDTPSMRVLAGLDLDGLPSAWEASELVTASLEELGFAPPDIETISYAYVTDAAKAALTGELSPQEAANRIHKLVVSPLDHPPDLMPWCYVWEGNAADCSRSLEDHEIDAEILRLAEQYVREHA